MSMHDYAVSHYGLLLNEDALKHIASRMFDDFTEVAWAKDKWDFIEGVRDELWIEYISEFTGEALGITDSGEIDCSVCDCYSGDVILYVGVSSFPTLFRAPYANIEELIEEFKDKAGEYLPEDFDYRGNIRHICGTYYG